MSELLIRNRQRVRPLNLPLLRRISLAVLEEGLKQAHFELGVHLVGATKMARLNEAFLNHPGSTDVITFDHTADGETGTLYGEIFICVDDAVAQAGQFGTTWQSELVRYVIHGILHLRGYDDLCPADRRIMKRAENRLLRWTASRFPLDQLARAKTRTRARRTAH